MTRLWMVRLGKFGEKEAHALETGAITDAISALPACPREPKKTDA